MSDHHQSHDHQSGPDGPLFHVVLHQPEIPNNTGNIGRTCVALGCPLHLVHPLGFGLDEKARRRAGLDYWPRVDLREHADWSAYSAAHAPRSAWFASSHGRRSIYEIDLRRGDHLVFGGETRGLPPQILQPHADRCFSLPMLPGERSLNLATAVCAVLYVGLGRLIQRGEAALAADGRLQPAAACGFPPKAAGLGAALEKIAHPPLNPDGGPA